MHPGRRCVRLPAIDDELLDIAVATWLIGTFAVRNSVSSLTTRRRLLTRAALRDHGCSSATRSSTYFAPLAARRSPSMYG